MGFLSALIPAVAGFTGSLFSAKSQERINQQNISSAQEQMDFQERMSSTAHQREVADLKAAGLNPILSANSGASTPGGSMAVVSNPYATMPADIATSAKSFMDMSLNRELVKSQQAQQSLSYAQANLANVNAAKTLLEVPKSAVVGTLGNFIGRGLDAVDSVTAKGASWLGRKVGSFSFPRFDLDDFRGGLPKG